MNPLIRLCTKFGRTPNNTTSARDGSKCCKRPGKREKNCKTFCGDAIPEMRRPRPNSKPERKEVNVRAVAFDGRYDGMRLKSMA